MTKAELVSHIAKQHPELVHPPAKDLIKWRKEEIERSHNDMHQWSGVSHNHT